MSRAIVQEQDGSFDVTLPGVKGQKITVHGLHPDHHVVTSHDVEPEGYPHVTWLANFIVTKTETGKKNKVKINYKARVDKLAETHVLVILENGHLVKLTPALLEKEFDHGDPAIGMTTVEPPTGVS